MTKEKTILYKQAYVELYSMLKKLPKEQYDKIPNKFIEYIDNEKDENYIFKYDNSIPLLEQNYMIETKALIVKLYEKYIAEDNEKDFWNKYDKICNNLIEDEKRKKYDVSNIFENNKIINKKEDENVRNLPIEIKHKSIFEKFINFIKSIFKK